MSEIKDAIKDTLDNALEMAIEQVETRKTFEAFSPTFRVIGDFDMDPINIKISGMSGIGKTARINSWAKDHPDINFVAFDAAILRVNRILVDGTEYDVVFSSNEIDSICKENTVVFVDNFQFIKPPVENELNKFFDDRSLVDPRTPKGIRITKNVLFAVVATTKQG